MEGGHSRRPHRASEPARRACAILAAAPRPGPDSRDHPYAGQGPWRTHDARYGRFIRRRTDLRVRCSPGVLSDALRTIDRSGRYYRVCDPTWADCCDGTFAQRAGGRWNPPGSFPTSYLNCEIETARANARRMYEGEAFGLFDLNPIMRPHLQVLELRACSPVDAVSERGLRALGPPITYPAGVSWEVCQPIGVRARARGFAGIAARSAVLSSGEELALFECDYVEKRQRLLFDAWYLG